MFVCQFEEIKNARVPDHHTIFKWHEFECYKPYIYIYASWSNMQKYYYIYPYLHGIGLI